MLAYIIQAKLITCEKCYCTVYTQVFQRMKEQVNKYTENINNFIKRWKWGKDKQSVRKWENQKRPEYLARAVLGYALYHMENDSDNGVSIYLTFGEIWTMHIFSGYITYKARELSAVKEEEAKQIQINSTGIV